MSRIQDKKIRGLE